MKEVSIGRVKRDISELVNRVAYGGERLVLTSRGKPKAALVSMEDYHRLQGPGADWERWLFQARQLDEQIVARRGGEPIDLERMWESERDDQERRLDGLSGR